MEAICTKARKQVASLVITSGNTTVFRFTGHFEHEPSGTTLALYRGYHSGMGRWLSRDPIGEEAGSNIYAYVKNAVLTQIDPLGLIDHEYFDGGWEDPNTRLFEDKSDTYDIGAHGDPDGLYDNKGNMFTPEEVYDDVKDDPAFKSARQVKIWACSAGFGKNSFAERFAKLSGKKTIAATGDLKAATRKGDRGRFSRFKGNRFRLFRPSTWSSGGWRQFKP